MSEWRGRPRIDRLRIRGLVLLALVVPVVGVVTVATESVYDRLAERDAAVQLRDAASEVEEGVEFRAAVAAEEVGSTVLGLANDHGLTGGAREQVREDLFDRLQASRADVDARRDDASAPRSPAVGTALARLDGLREALDAGEAGHAEVTRVFTDLDAALALQWVDELAAIERRADRQPLPGPVRARLRTTRHSIEAVTLSAPRINAALDILLDQPSPATVEELIALGARFDAARTHAAPRPGTAAATAWQAFADDPAAARTEAVITTAVAVGLGEQPPWPELELDLLLRGLEDGERWGLLQTDIVDAAARDLVGIADGLAVDASAAVRDQVALAVALVVLTGTVGLVTARTLTRPSLDLQAAARRVAAGDFESEAVAVRGPVELRETVEAFNDMTATLAAVEDHVVALAEDPSSPLLDDPLPGRTGQALQQAIDGLRTSVHDAEVLRLELVELATRDDLTGLLNRAAAFAAIGRDLARARRDGDQLLACYVDLDGLKGLNDVYGHDVGDQAIRNTADALRATTREADVVARLGGDEFMVVGPVPDGGVEGVAAFAERVRAAVALRSVRAADGTTLPLRCSVGVTVSGPDVGDAEALVRAADEAMYQAKHGGRDRVAWVDASSSTVVRQGGHEPPEA